MDFLDQKFSVVTHLNSWGIWEFVFEGEFLCGLCCKDFFIKNKQIEIFENPQNKATFLDENSKKISPLFDEAKKQLDLYLLGRLKNFDLPLKMYGTEFQKKVWQKTAEIPYGKTCTYKQIAEQIQSPKAVRAVGGALHINPLQIIIPCHRVVGAKGLTGYALGIFMKQQLLELEKK